MTQCAPSPTIRQGFTLVELLVVVAIIALLISILLPALNKARDVARETLCRTSMRQVGLSQLMYASSYAGYVRPPWWGSRDGTGMQEWFLCFVELDYIDGYIKNKDIYNAANRSPEVLICPSADNAVKHIDDPWQMNATPFSKNGRARVCFMMHEGMMGEGPPGGKNKQGRFARLSTFRASMPMYFEKIDRWQSGSPQNNAETHVRGMQTYKEPLKDFLESKYLVMRHGDEMRQNVAFVDNSVSIITEDVYRTAITKYGKNFYKYVKP